MSALGYLIPISIALGVIGLAIFLWALTTDQYDDLDGDAHRVLLSEAPPIVPPRGDDG